MSIICHAKLVLAIFYQSKLLIRFRGIHWSGLGDPTPQPPLVAFLIIWRIMNFWFHLLWIVKWNLTCCSSQKTIWNETHFMWLSLTTFFILDKNARVLPKHSPNNKLGELLTSHPSKMAHSMMPEILSWVNLCFSVSFKLSAINCHCYIWLVYNVLLVHTAKVANA